MDLLHRSLNSKVIVKLRHGRELAGKLVAYDEHLNLMLNDVTEKIKYFKTDPKTNRQVQFVSEHQTSQLFSFIFVC